MRCRNCGFENEDGRYICQNCGSPLYDEGEEIDENAENGTNPVNDDEDDENRKNTKKSIIVIIVLAVILVALVAGIVFAVSHSGSNKEETSSESETISSSQYREITSRKRPTTSNKTTASEKTTEKTTESATEKTTQSTTTSTKATKAVFSVYVDIDGNGSVTGEGEYENGKQAVLVATPDADSQFIGWYDNDTGELRASGSKYTVRVNKNINLTAKFQKVDETSEAQ